MITLERNSPGTATVGRRLMAAIAFGFSLIAVNAADAADTFRHLKGKEIKAKFAGMDFTDDVHWADAFGRDGRIVRYDMGKKNAGKWRVEKGQLCISVEGEETCYQVWISDTAVQLRDPDGTFFLEGVLQKPSARD
ncbi:hypothetical protein NKI56_18780 [Mesorhizobium sp. M0622]|uniref:hypothetical protein n=1 Tax=unclassified Mesorhizobium TaxID=325217 RepID=UPI00333D03F4